MSIFDDLGSLVGIGGGGQGPNTQIPLQNVVTPEQAAQNYAQQQQGLTQQQALINAMQQAGQQSVYGSQTGLMNQLQQQSMGQGPNPAQAQLAQNTSDASQRQAALMAGQRGTGANAGLMARQIAMQGGHQQQQMLGQAATLQAQQQLAAQQQLGQQQAQMAGQLGGAINAHSQAAQGAYGQSLGGINAQNQAAIGVGNIQANQANANYAADQKRNGGALGGIGSMLQMGGGKDMLGNLFGSGIGPEIDISGSGAEWLSGAGQGLSAAGGTMMAGGAMDAVGAGASTYGPMAAADAAVMMAAHGGQIPNHDGPRSKAGQHFRNMKSGGNVPGKAAVAGDSRKNDNQKAMLSPGEIVIPRSIAMGKNAPEKAAAFVRACLAKRGPKVGRA